MGRLAFAISRICQTWKLISIFKSEIYQKSSQARDVKCDQKRFLSKHTGGCFAIDAIADRAKGAVPVRVAVKVPQEEQGVYL